MLLLNTKGHTTDINASFFYFLQESLLQFVKKSGGVTKERRISSMKCESSIHKAILHDLHSEI